MTTAAAIILEPLDITPTMVIAGTSVPEVDTARGEVAWVAGSHASGAKNVNCDGALWEAVATPGSTRPGADYTKWRRTGPSNRMAPFDYMRSTAAEALGELVFVLQPGFYNGLRLDGLAGEYLEVVQYERTSPDPEGLQVLQRWSGDMYEQARGLFEYLYMPLRQIKQKHWLDWPMAANAELHIRITASNNGRCAVGMITLGFWETLLGQRADFGGVEYGAESTIKTHTTVADNPDGSWEFTPRTGVSNNISCTVVIDADEANAAHELIARASGKPVVFIASGLPRYDYLNTFCFLSASVSPTNWGVVQLRLTGKGSI